jgi:hypothetical protein
VEDGRTGKARAAEEDAGRSVCRALGGSTESEGATRTELSEAGPAHDAAHAHRATRALDTLAPEVSACSRRR